MLWGLKPDPCLPGNTIHQGLQSQMQSQISTEAKKERKPVSEGIRADNVVAGERTPHLKGRAHCQLQSSATCRNGRLVLLKQLAFLGKKSKSLCKLSPF